MSLHDRGTMILDGALADAKSRGDIVTWKTRKDQFHHLALSRRKPGELVGRCFLQGT